MDVRDSYFLFRLLHWPFSSEATLGVSHVEESMLRIHSAVPQGNNRDYATAD